MYGSGAAYILFECLTDGYGDLEKLTLINQSEEKKPSEFSKLIFFFCNFFCLCRDEMLVYLEHRIVVAIKTISSGLIQQQIEVADFLSSFSLMVWLAISHFYTYHCYTLFWLNRNQYNRLGYIFMMQF